MGASAEADRECSRVFRKSRAAGGHADRNAIANVDQHTGVDANGHGSAARHANTHRDADTRAERRLERYFHAPRATDAAQAGEFIH